MYAAVRLAAIGFIAFLALNVPALAQRSSLPVMGGEGANLPANSAPNNPAPTFEADPWSTTGVPPAAAFPNPVDVMRMTDAEACNTWTESGTKSPTVSVARLAIPGKATSEYQKGCGALKGKRFDDAEEHVRRAIEIYPHYAAAWVVLGQIFGAQKKVEDARQACSQARSLDPTYVAPYLCLSDIAANEGDWQEVSILSGSALTVDPTSNSYAFYYASAAALHLNELSRAEQDAQNAIKLDTWHHLPQLHLLLAQIFQAEANPRGQAIQLREYLKNAPASPETDKVRGALAQLDAQTAAKQ